MLRLGWPTADRTSKDPLHWLAESLLAARSVPDDAHLTGGVPEEPGRAVGRAFRCVARPDSEESAAEEEAGAAC